MATLDFGVDTFDTMSFDTVSASAGVDQSSTVDYYIPPAGSLLTLDPTLFPNGSVSTSDSTIYSAPIGPELPTPVQGAPQSVSPGSPAGSGWAALLGFGAPLVGSAVKALAKGGIVQNTGAPGASLSHPASAQPLRTFFDTTNHGITGQQVVLGGLLFLALIYGVNKLR